MKPRHQRLAFLLVGLAMIGGAATVVLREFRDNLVFFYSPSEVLAGKAKARPVFRVGGLVEAGSIDRINALPAVRFRVTDGNASLAVVTRKALPTLFREGQGVVAEGTLRQDGVFAATRVLAKHDENYMPPEVVRALKESGRWKGESQGMARPDRNAPPEGSP